MAEDKESKTEDPTDKRVRDAIEEGNMPISREASTLASFIAIFLALSFLIAGNTIHLTNALSRFIDNPGAWELENSGDALVLAQFLGHDIVRLLAPIIGLILVAGVAATILQHPPQLALKRITPDWSRISPMRMRSGAWRSAFLSA